MCNGSHRLAGPNGKQRRTANQKGAEAGIAITANRRLKDVVTQLCTVRRAKYGRDKSGVKPGTITELLTQNYESKRVAEHERRLAKEEEEKTKMAKKHLNKAVKFKMAAEEPLARTSLELEQHLKAMDYKKGVCIAYLKRQFDARTTRADLEEYTYDTLPNRFRSAHTKQLVKKPQDNVNPMTYLSDLVAAMITIDCKRTFRQEIALSGLLRKTPVLEADTTNPISTEAKKQMDEYLVLQAEQVDDPWLLLLEKEYKGQVCFVHDIAARHKLFRVAKIAYWPSTKREYANWEATFEPIHLAPDGSCFVHPDDCVIGPNGTNVTKAKSYLGFIVAQYIYGDNEDPERTQCVDEYICDALGKHSRYEANRAQKEAAMSNSTSTRPATLRHAHAAYNQKEFQRDFE
jgi:hypothetical protein